MSVSTISEVSKSPKILAKEGTVTATATVTVTANEVQHAVAVTANKIYM